MTDNKSNKPARAGGNSRRAPARQPRASTNSKPSGGNRRNSRPPRRPKLINPPSNGPVIKIPPLKDGDIRIIPLGGVEEVGKNMTAIEYKDSILIIDIGFQIAGDETPGVDYIIPDTTYVEANKHKIKGVMITHGHLDHIGGIPYIMDKIGNPTIYTSLLTAVMIKKRQEEFPHLPKLDIRMVNQDHKLTLGDLTVRFFGVTHTIPDAFGVIVETPYGNVIFTGDVKIENFEGKPADFEEKIYGDLGKEKNLLLVADSTNVAKEGFSYPEKEVHKNLKEIIDKIKGRIIVSTFASLFDRIISIVQSAEELGKKVVVEGRSMKNNVEIAKELGILKVKPETIIPGERMGDYPDNKLVILATGAQGDEFAALMRMSNREHRTVKIKKGDTVLLSSSVIPGNEKSVSKLKDNLTRQGAKIIHYGVANVHSSGHSYRGELEWVHKMIKPKFFIPVHGSHYMLRTHEDLAVELGMPEKNVIVPDNGAVIEVQDKGKKLVRLKESASARVVMVDGLDSNNVQEVVIRDRQMLSQDGMFVIIAIIDIKTGKVRKSPDIISRGFVYLKESQELLRHIRFVTKKTIEDSAAKMHPLNFDYLKNAVREEIGKELFKKTAKRPIILPVLIEV